MIFTKKVATFLTHPQSIAFFLACFFFLLYFSTAPRTNVSYADSDLLTTIGYHLGVAHPPGYPLLILILYFFTHLPLPTSIAFKANLSSIFLHSLAIFFTYLGTHRFALHLFKPRPQNSPSSKTTIILASLISTISLATAYLFWLYSTIAEKYPLNDLFIALLLYLVMLLSTSTQKKLSAKPWLIFFIVLALALNHHHTILLFLPTIIYFLLPHLSSLKAFAKLILPTFLLALIFPLVVLLLLNTTPASVSWHFPSSLEGLIRMLTRRDLTGYLVLTGQYRGMYLKAVNLSEIASKLPAIADNFILQLGALPSALSLLGLVFLARSHHRLHRLILLTALCTTLFIPLYLEWPQDLSIQALRIRLYLAGFMVVPYLIIAGLYLLTRISTPKPRLKLAHQTLIPTLFLILFFTLTPLALQYPQINLRHFDTIHSYYSDILQPLPPHSILACMSDVSCFALLYLQQAEQLRSDILILPHSNHIVAHRLNQIKNLRGFSNPDNPEAFFDFLTWNLQKGPVYVTELQPLYYQMLGLDYGFVKYIPLGYYGQLSLSLPGDLPTPDYSLSRQLSRQTFPLQDHHRLQLKASLAQKHLLNARVFSQLNQNQYLIDREIYLAQSLTTQLPPIYQSQAQDFPRQLTLGYRQYVPGVPNPTPEQILSQAERYFHQGQLDLVKLGFLGVLAQDPLNLPARLRLAWLYHTNGLTIPAKQEYQNILRYYPQNPEATQWLKLLP